MGRHHDTSHTAVDGCQGPATVLTAREHHTGGVTMHRRVTHPGHVGAVRRVQNGYEYHVHGTIDDDAVLVRTT